MSLVKWIGSKLQGLIQIRALHSRIRVLAAGGVAHGSPTHVIRITRTAVGGGCMASQHGVSRKISQLFSHAVTGAYQEEGLGGLQPPYRFLFF